MENVTFVHWALLIAAMMPYFVVFIVKIGKGYDNADPRHRDNLATPLQRRAYDAHVNCLEAFPFFAVAVLLALVLGLEPASLNLAAGLWVAFRLGFVACYLTNQAALRSLIWWAANICTLTIFLKALL